MVVKAMTLRTLAAVPESARACTAQGRFMRQKCRSFSSFGVVSAIQTADTSVM